MLDYITPGQRLLTIQAATWNALIDVARAHRGKDGGPEFGAIKSAALAYGVIVTVVNGTTHEYEAYHPVHLGDVAVAPATNQAEFETRPSFEVYSPVSDQLCRGNWGIALDKIEAWDTESNKPAGRVLLCGVTVCKVTKRAGTDYFVDTGGTTTADDNYKLSTRAAGAGRLLWIDDELEDDDEGWAVVHVLGYQCVEPARWATLDSALHYNTVTDATLKYLSPSATTVLTTVTPTRKVKVRCLDIADGDKIPSGAEVWIVPEPYSGLWEVQRSRSCREPE